MNSFEMYRKVRKFGKEHNITFKEAMGVIAQEEENWKFFKARVGLIEKLILNPPDYSHQPKPSDYRELTTPSEILDFIKVRGRAKTFKVIFKDDTYYQRKFNGSCYTECYDLLVVNYLKGHL